MDRYHILKLEYSMGDEVFNIHPVLIQEGDELILCDAGYPDQLSQIETELERCGYSINDLTKVVVTHHDHDHIGSLKMLKERNSSLKVVTSKIEKPFIDGSKKSLRLIQAEEYNKTLSEDQAEYGELFVKYLKSINSVAVDMIVSEDDYIAKGVRIISTPGHTPGHLSVWLEEESVLIVGDALVCEDNQLVIANPEFTLDMDACLESIRKIKSMDANMIICYHGGSVKSDISEMINKLLI